MPALPLPTLCSLSNPVRGLLFGALIALSGCSALPPSSHSPVSHELVGYDNVAIETLVQGSGPAIVMLPSLARDGLEDFDAVAESLAASGFTNRARTASELAAFWRELAARRRLARVLFQDGIGAGKMTLAAWPAYLEALRARLGRRLDVVVEIFEPVPDPAGFRAQPAPLERVRLQAGLARRATGRPPLCFSLPDYAVPQAGASAAALFDALAAAPSPP